MLRRISPLLLCLVFAFTFVACDSGDDDDGGNGGPGSIGSSNVTVSGAFSDSFSGSAAFGVAEDGSSFSLAIFEGGFPTTGAFGGAVIGIGRDGGRPGEGTYPLDASSSGFGAGYASDIGVTTGGTFVGNETGTLTITSSSSDRIVGSFTFTGPGSSLSGPLGDATVEGSFSAEFVSDVPSTGL